MLSRLLDRLVSGDEVALVVEGVEDAEDVDPHFGRLLDEGLHHVVRVVAVPDEVLSAEEHLKFRLAASWLLRMRTLSQGSSFRNRVVTSKVAPPHTSIE